MAAICNHVIGLWNDFDNTDTITLNGLKRKVKEQEEIYEHFRDNGVIGEYYMERFKPKWTLNDYFDKRKMTNLERFNFCPICGHEINWKGMKMHG